MTAMRIEPEDARPEDIVWADSEADADLENWTPLDLVTPERLMRQLAGVMRRMDHINAQAREMREPIDTWEQRMIDPLMERAYRLDDQLKELARRYREADEKHNKTLRLPSGEVRSTSTNPRVAVEDEAALIAFLRNFAKETGSKPEDYLAVSVKPKMDPLKKLATIIETHDAGPVACAHGEPIPGVVVVPGGVNFTVKPS